MNGQPAKFGSAQVAYNRTRRTKGPAMERMTKRTLFGLSAVAFFAILEIAVIVAAVMVALKVTFGVPIPFVGYFR